MTKPSAISKKLAASIPRMRNCRNCWKPPGRKKRRRNWWRDTCGRPTTLATGDLEGAGAVIAKALEVDPEDTRRARRSRCPGSSDRRSGSSGQSKTIIENARQEIGARHLPLPWTPSPKSNASILRIPNSSTLQAAAKTGLRAGTAPPHPRTTAKRSFARRYPRRTYTRRADGRPGSGTHAHRAHPHEIQRAISRASCAKRKSAPRRRTRFRRRTLIESSPQEP